MVAPAVIGALAPDPARQTPPRAKGPARDIGLRRAKEPAWKEEVRDRVQRRRRRKEQDGELPLFDTPQTEAGREFTVSPEVEASSEHEAASESEAEVAPDFHGHAAYPGPALLGEEEPSAELGRAPSVELGGEAPSEPELPLRPEPAPEMPAPVLRVETTAAPEDEEPEDDWLRRIEPPPLRPVERPAAFGDRIEAALVDAGLLLVLDAVVIYFAGRAAQAEFGAVLRHWPWLLGFLAFLGLTYAAWFTGTTGQTPGKMLVGLRVVESAGRPPGYPRALLRAALGALGSALLGLGMLPLFFDPARRALHDRLLRTRVVKF